MSQNLDAGFFGRPQSDYEEWRHLLQKVRARYNPEGVEPNAFTGWICPIEVCGFNAIDVGSNVPLLERDGRDIRLDGKDLYFVLFPLRVPYLMTQNDQAIRLGVGDVALVDTARPVKFLADFDRKEPWRHLGINLPRQELVTHLGFEPQGGLVRPNGTPAGRLLLELFRSANQEPASESSSADSYMRLAVYDLVGAMFAPSDRSSASGHTDKIFARVCDIIKQGYADPDFGPPEVAARTGISLRYLENLFTQRDSTCREFIYSVRLDHAARLLRRRESLRSDQPLGEIAYACGFRDYTHFARKFCYRFGYPPGAHPAKNDSTVAVLTERGRSMRADLGLVTSSLVMEAAGSNDCDVVARGGWSNHYADARSSPPQGISEALTERERDILIVISQGLSNKHIARALKISPETVKSHVKNIFLKLAVSTRAAAIWRAGALGLL